MDGWKLELRDQGIAGFLKVQPLGHETQKKGIKSLNFSKLSPNLILLNQLSPDST